MRKHVNSILEYFKTFPLMNVSTFFSLGVSLGILLGVVKGLVVSFLLIVFVILLIQSEDMKKFAIVLCLSLLFLLLGLFRCQYYYFALSKEGNIKDLAYREVEIKGVVDSDIKIKKNEQIFIISKVSIIQGEGGEASSIDNKLLVKYSRLYPTIEYGDSVVVKGKLEIPNCQETTSYCNYLYSKNIYSILTCISLEKIDTLNTSSEKRALIRLKEFKDSLSSKISGLVGEPHASLLSGMIFGGFQNMSEDFENALRRTGTTHIIAVSGFNVTILIVVLGIFSPLLGRQRLHFLTIVFLIFFIFFVGVDNIPVVRAGLMGVTFIIGQITGRKRIIFPLLSFTVALFLLQNPYTLLSLSFQLSFLSTLGLLTLSEKIQKFPVFLPEALREDFSSTIAAIVFTLPVTISNFNKLSLVSPVVNLLVLPVVPFVTVGGMILILLLILFPAIGQIVVYFFWIILEFMIRIIRLFSSLSFAEVEVDPKICEIIKLALYFVVIYFTVRSFRSTKLIKN